MRSDSSWEFKLSKCISSHSQYSLERSFFFLILQLGPSLNVREQNKARVPRPRLTYEWRPSRIGCVGTLKNKRASFKRSHKYSAGTAIVAGMWCDIFQWLQNTPRTNCTNLKILFGRTWNNEHHCEIPWRLPGCIDRHDDRVGDISTAPAVQDYDKSSWWDCQNLRMHMFCNCSFIVKEYRRMVYCRESDVTQSCFQHR